MSHLRDHLKLLKCQPDTLEAWQPPQESEYSMAINVLEVSALGSLAANPSGIYLIGSDST